MSIFTLSRKQFSNKNLLLPGNLLASVKLQYWEDLWSTYEKTLGPPLLGGQPCI